MNKYTVPIILVALVVAFAGVGYIGLGGTGNPIFSWQDEPIIRISPGSDESEHVEYPSVYSLGEARGLLYSAYGDDQRWRIKLAVAQTGHNFVRQGNIFDESKLPFKGAYAFPFVNVSSRNGKAVFNLYFSAADGDEPSRYTAVYHAFSDNGLSWSAPEKLLADNALDPVVVTSNGKALIVYSSVINGTNVIRSAVLLTANTAQDIRTVYSAPSGFYTMGAVTIDNKPVLILETEKNWIALCFNASGDLTQVSTSPLLEFEKGTGILWDRLKYGMSFHEASSPPAFYYNGIAGHGVPVGGQIGIGTYDPHALASKLDMAGCK
ncbi:putative uncharacterized protein [Pseudomonas sp. StFLB209]|uniref:hypothetical protein n=1 Tax=Pseudomonas sp. StFLB209 TaxID=1028989 RepID=UPI0004F67353|nr:hypothetical protein [Pseudomonas sp. StFLB209]BAP43575.1 putative uncharacterized protein [Pseudomonas sp. StFLB209]